MYKMCFLINIEFKRPLHILIGFEIKKNCNCILY